MDFFLQVLAGIVSAVLIAVGSFSLRVLCKMYKESVATRKLLAMVCLRLQAGEERFQRLEMAVEGHGQRLDVLERDKRIEEAGG